MANSVDPDQTAPIGAVCSGFKLFASMLNSSVMLGNYLQQTTSADDILRCVFFLGALRVNLLTEHNLELLNLKGGYTGCSESTLVKITHTKARIQVKKSGQLSLPRRDVCQTRKDTHQKAPNAKSIALW